MKPLLLPEAAKIYMRRPLHFSLPRGKIVPKNKLEVPP